MAPKKGKGSKKDDFDDNEVAEKPSKASSKSKSKGKHRDDSPEGKKVSEDAVVENFDSDEGGSSSKKDRKKSKIKEDADKAKNLKTVGQSTSTSKSMSKKKQKGKGKDQQWNSDEEPELDLLNNKYSDSDDNDLLPVRPTIKKKTNAKPKPKIKLLEESEDSGAESLSSSESGVEDLTSKVSNVDISKSTATDKSLNKLDDKNSVGQIQADKVDVVLPQGNSTNSNDALEGDEDSKVDEDIEEPSVITGSATGKLIFKQLTETLFNFTTNNRTLGLKGYIFYIVYMGQ